MTALRVKKSEVAQGDGVFSVRGHQKGDRVTWIEVDAADFADDPPYWVQDVFARATQKYASKNSDPDKGGVGHLINDGTKIAGIDWTSSGDVVSGVGCVEQYVTTSTQMANVDLLAPDGGMGGGSSPKIWVVATRNIAPGEELLRHYGGSYWLTKAETEILIVCNLLRVEFRLVASMFSEPKKTILLDRARATFASACARLDTLSNEYQVHRGPGMPWRQQHLYKDFDGYSLWFWISGDNGTLRATYASKLNFYDLAFLPEGDGVSQITNMLRNVHAMPYPVFLGALIPKCGPHITIQHNQDALAAQKAMAAQGTTFGAEPGLLPW